MGLFRKYRIDQLDLNLSREDLLRKSRVLIVDDERPDLIEDLKRARFSVDYESDITKENMDIVERPTYDLVILDFGSVGTTFGADQGLSLLRYIKRVNPSLVVFAYTSKALGIEHADFYRLADGTLPKDAGIGESMEKIEEGLRKAHSIENLWSGMLNIAGVRPSSEEDIGWQNLFVRGLKNRSKMKIFRDQFLNTIGGQGAQKVGLVILEKLIELGAKAAIGG